MNRQNDDVNEAAGARGFSPRDVVDNIIRRGDPDKRGIRPYIEALSYSRWQRWHKLEAEQYVKLGVLLDQYQGTLDEDVTERLCEELRRTELTEDVDVMLRVLFAAVDHLPPGALFIRQYLATFDRWLENPLTTWPTRTQVGKLLEHLGGRYPEEAENVRDTLRSKLPDWAIEYHTGDERHGFDRRSRAVFNALTAAPWSKNPEGNEQLGLSGALACALDKLMCACRQDWFCGFVHSISRPIAAAQMFRRVKGETLYLIGAILAGARRDVYHESPEAAFAITTLEEAIHRPHRLQMERSPVKLEIELPGERGFGTGVRLQVFDISRDGCLAVVNLPARFEETAPGDRIELDRGFERTFGMHRFAGVLQALERNVAVHPGTELMLYDAANQREWGAIDGASVVRFTPDEAGGRLWLGFHFDRVVPQVQQELDELINTAA